MKRIFFAGLFLLLLFPVPGHAFHREPSSPSPFEARYGPVNFGFEIRLTNRDLLTDSAVFPGGGPGCTGTGCDSSERVFDKERIAADSVRLLARLGLDLKWFEIWALAGGSGLSLDVGDFDARFSFAYGGGGRFNFYRSEGDGPIRRAFLDYEFLAFTAQDQTVFDPVDPDTPVTCTTSGGLTVCNPNLLRVERVHEEIDWREHTIRAGVEGGHDRFIPYGGIRFSFVDGKDRIDATGRPLEIDFKEEDTFGLFLGTRYLLDRKSSLFVELGMIDQFNLSGGVRVAF